MYMHIMYIDIMYIYIYIYIWYIFIYIYIATKTYGLRKNQNLLIIKVSYILCKL